MQLGYWITGINGNGNNDSIVITFTHILIENERSGKTQASSNRMVTNVLDHIPWGYGPNHTDLLFFISLFSLFISFTEKLTWCDRKLKGN